MKQLFLAFVIASCSAEPVLAADLPCDQPDKAHVDTDGMPFCPQVVADNSAFSVYRCALAQAKSFHKPSPAEKALTHDLITGFKADSAPAILAAADSLGLQACRVKSEDYLLVYTKPGVRDYSGAFYMFREKGASKVIIVSPHDDSDGTHSDTKIALAKSKALMVISNGHKRQNGDGLGDFVHDPCGANLGCVGTAAVGDAFPGSVWLHVHGMVNGNAVLYRGRNDVFNKVYEKAIRDNTNIEKLNPAFNADFSIDKVVNTNFYIKTEIPVRIHQNNPTAIAKVVADIEKNDWAWPGAKAAFAHPVSTATPLVWEGPPKTPVVGTKTLTCVAMQWTDNHVATLAKCRESAQLVASFFDRNSRGLLKLTPSAKLVHAGYSTGVATEGKDLTVMRGAVKSDLYILPRVFVKGASHAGSKTAWMNGFSWDVSHEVGHLLGLGHAGANMPDGSYDQYGDHGSVMGNHQSNLLTAPQYYHLGWLPPSEVMIYDPSAPEYELKKLNLFDAPGLSTVIINPTLIGGGRPGFLSFVDGCKKGCVAYHLANDGGGSSRIKAFGDEYEDSHLRVKVLAIDGQTVKISVVTK